MGLTVLGPQSLSDAELEVWNLEVKYWECRTSGDVDQYMALWDDQFIGWPEGQSRPGDKTAIRRRFETYLADARPGSIKATLEPLSVRVRGDIASVFYRARYGKEDRNGAGVESYIRVTHTWKRLAGVWRIIAGMSAVEASK